MIELNEENKRLFGDQVNDHIEKLSDLLAMPAGTAIEESMIRKACLATRLLEGSARMLGLDAWSATLEMFRGLIEGAAGGGRDWDEQLSQIVSEIVEAEEQVVAEILAGEIDSVDCPAAFDGIRRETEILLGEAPASDGGRSMPVNSAYPSRRATAAKRPSVSPPSRSTRARRPGAPRTGSSRSIGSWIVSVPSGTTSGNTWRIPTATIR